MDVAAADYSLAAVHVDFVSEGVLGLERCAHLGQGFGRQVLHGFLVRLFAGANALAQLDAYFSDNVEGFG